MTAIRAPRSQASAVQLLERYAELDAEVVKLEAERTAAIAHVNARYDAAGAEALAERGAIADKLQAWWFKAGKGLTGGKRKSIALGGCEIGSRAGRFSLGVEGSEEAVIAALQKREWAADLLRTRVSLDRKAVLEALDGKFARQLGKLGLLRTGGEEAFFIRRTGQDGTLGSAA